MKKPERDKAKEAELFPGTSSSTETDVMVWADVLDQREFEHRPKSSFILALWGNL